MITNEKINSNHFHLPVTSENEGGTNFIEENKKKEAKEDTSETLKDENSTTSAADLSEDSQVNTSEQNGNRSRPQSQSTSDYAQSSNCSNPTQVENNATDSANIFLDQSNSQMNDSCKSNLFSNFSSESNDKIWSILGESNSEEYNSQNYAQSLNKNNSPFKDQNLIQKSQINASMLKKPMSRNDGNFNMPTQSYSNYNRNQCISPMVGGGPRNQTNWPIGSQTTNAVPSNLTWSNNFNSSQPSVATFSNMNNMNANSWQNGIGPNNFSNQKRIQMCNPNNINAAMKKHVYGPNDGQLNYGSNPMMPAKYRQNTIHNFKNYANNPIYDMGSTGSDNTSSSSDSANLRDNALFQIQNRNLDQNCGPLDTLRYSLEPQIMEIVRNNPPQDNKSSSMNFPFQTIDDKKQLKNRNFGTKRGKSPFFTGQQDSENFFFDTNTPNIEPTERFSRKVFVGGLPPDIDEEEITASFRRFGSLVVDWPHKAESKSYFPPKGYAFLLFQDESSVQMLIEQCMPEDDKLYLCVSSPTIKDKAVQIRPWRLTDADYVLDASMPLDPRKTVFVGGVPRPLKAVELAMIMDRLYGGVCYAGIDTDPELKYPKGAGRVAFSSQQSYIAAISARFVQLQHADIEKRVEVKPYVLDDQNCDECQGARCGGKFAPFFCANIHCLQYYCENCWATIHSRPGREFHKPLVKEGADRPRAVPFRWC